MDFYKPQYHMVWVNLVALCLVLCGWWWWEKTRGSKKFPWFKALIVLGILPVLSIFRQGTYESGDLSINVYKLISFVKNLQEGVLIPRWAGELNATFGYPKFIFAYPLPYYLGALGWRVGLSYLAGIKGVLIATYLASGATMYWWLKHEVSAKASFWGALSYLFAPYHLVNMHFRVDIGEMTAVAVLPLAMLGISQSVRTGKLKWLVLAGVSWGLLVISHQAVALMAYPLGLLYGLWKLRGLKPVKLIKLIIPLIWGLALTAYYWLPAMMESRFTQQSFQLLAVSYLSISQLVLAPWRYGFLFQGPRGELAFILGYGHWLVVGMAVWLLKKKAFSANARREMIWWLMVLAMTIFMMLKISQPVWMVLPLLNKMQFSYRWLNLAILASAVITALVMERVGKRYIAAGVMALMVGTTILNWGNRRVISEWSDQYFINGVPASIAQAEGLIPAAPRWTDHARPWQTVPPAQHLETIAGRVRVLKFWRTTNTHRYFIQADQDSTLRENTLYFPGWEVKIDGIPTLTTIGQTEPKGTMIFEVPAGLHEIEVEFKKTPIRLVAERISIAALIMVISSIFTLIYNLWMKKSREQSLR